MRSGRSSLRTLIAALCGLVVLLLGVVAGQYLERSKAVAAGTSASPREGPSLPETASLSSTEYWISPPALDASRSGFAAWTVLRPGGSFVLERCRAPDYAIPEGTRAPLPFPVARCELIVDGSISRLGENEILVRQGNGPARTFRYSLVREGTGERLLLDVGTTVTLLPGSKNSLFDRLQSLPGDEDSRNRYTRRMFELGVSPR